MPPPAIEPMAGGAHSYYRRFPGFNFLDLDDTDAYRACESALKSRSTKNFIADFGGSRVDGGEAWCALNVGVAGIRTLLEERRRVALRTRWINIFDPYDQAELVNNITEHYGFSPRLSKVITTPPASRPRPPLSVRPPSRMRDRILGRTSASSGLEEMVRDLEQQQQQQQQGELPHSMYLQPNTNQPMHVGDVLEMVDMENAVSPTAPKMNYMNLVQNVWHFHAVEWGGRFICIGFNHHHKTSPETWDRKQKSAEEPEEDGDEPFDTGDYNPEGKRLWSWLVLCDDGTVISIHEPLDTISKPEDILIIRRNMLTVFRSLSLSSAAQTVRANASAVAIGSGLDDLPFRRQQPRSENVYGGPSLLLYYLFDDWHSSYGFVQGRGAPYSTQMRNLRNQMHKDPQLSHLSQLHRLSRQLAILKRMYETKKIIVDNILHRQENSSNKLKPPSPTFATGWSEADPRDPTQMIAKTMGDSDILGVPLQPLAIAKFERLRDRIKLYVLGELEALLAEKAELETLTFNLISLKQSTTVELLTRVTIWFAGFTFVFLPLTLVTGYFSMQLKETQGRYDQRTFWGSAGATMSLTIIVLYTVGKSTGTMEFDSMWRGVKKVWFSWLKKKRDRKRRRNTLQQLQQQQQQQQGPAVVVRKVE